LDSLCKDWNLSDDVPSGRLISPFGMELFLLCYSDM